MEAKDVISAELHDDKIIPPIDLEKLKCNEFIQIEMVLLNAYNKPKFTSALMYRLINSKDHKQIIDFIIDSINIEQCKALELTLDRTIETELIHTQLVRSFCLECFRVIIKENYNQLCILSYHDLFDDSKNIKGKRCEFNSNRIKITFSKINFDFYNLSFF